jgi:hypothetical protein
MGPAARRSLSVPPGKILQAQVGPARVAVNNLPNLHDVRMLQSRNRVGFVDEARHRLTFVLQPWQLLAVILVGWVNREQQQRIEYLRTETQILEEKLGKKRILLSDDQRRRLAVKGKVLGRKAAERNASSGARPRRKRRDIFSVGFMFAFLSKRGYRDDITDR